MSYYNYIDHPRYGRIWFEITLRNWWCMGHSEEQNLDMGPLCVITTRDYLLAGGGKSPKEAITHLEKMLNWYADDDLALPELVKPVRSSLRSRWRYWRLMQQMKRDGKLCRITKDTGR